MNPHPKWLREAAKHMFADGHVAWGNTCERAADDYDALYAEKSKLQQACGDYTEELAYLRHERCTCGMNRSATPQSDGGVES